MEKIISTKDKTNFHILKIINLHFIIAKIKKYPNRNIKIDDNIKIIDFDKKHIISEAARHYNLPRTTVSYWMQQTEHLLACPNPKNKSTFHPGAKPKFEEIEDKLFEFVDFNR